MDYKSSNKIVQGKMKDMEVSKTKRKKISVSKNSDSKKNIQQSPGIDALQKKYLDIADDGYQPTSDSNSSAKKNDNDDDVDVKIIVPKKKQVDAGGAALKNRTVILSKKKGFLGSQG